MAVGDCGEADAGVMRRERRIKKRLGFMIAYGGDDRDGRDVGDLCLGEDDEFFGLILDF